jgi:NADH-quinone oxidoreductase subunit A
MLAQVSAAASAACPGSGSTDCTAYSDLLRSYLTVVVFAGLAIGLVAAMLGVASLLRPSSKRGGRYQWQKHLTYESGVDPVGSAWTQSQVRYYMFALLFVMFDVEAVFIFPWATRLEVYDTFGLVEMLVFMGILILGLVYAWRKKVLQWL